MAKGKKKQPALQPGAIVVIDFRSEPSNSHSGVFKAEVLEVIEGNRVKVISYRRLDDDPDYCPGCDANDRFPRCDARYVSVVLGKDKKDVEKKNFERFCSLMNVIGFPD